MDIILIAAMAANRVIGHNNATPWHIPEELRFFKQTTIGHPIIMGRKTFSSLQGPLPGRRNIIISRSPAQGAADTETVTSLAEAVDRCHHHERVFIIGGAQIFALAMPLATTILLSVLAVEVVGDTYFPDIPPAIFKETGRQHHHATIPFTVITYQRCKPD